MVTIPVEWRGHTLRLRHRGLSPDAKQMLARQILDGIAGGCYSPSKLAREYGTTKRIVDKFRVTIFKHNPWLSQVLGRTKLRPDRKSRSEVEELTPQMVEQINKRLDELIQKQETMLQIQRELLELLNASKISRGSPNSEFE